MQILKPLGYLKSAKVENWREIKEEARELREFMIAGKYDGHWNDAYAIHHVQISRDPKDFFVLNEIKIKDFGHWCIINPKILKQWDEVLHSEGCMSFMFRQQKCVERFFYVRVLYWTPFLNLFLIPRIKTFKQINAFIMQHEIDHAQGKNIYGV